MTDPEVVVRLLAAIDERELTAKRALAGHPATDFDMSNAYMTRVWRARYHEVVARMTQEPTPQQLAVFLPGVNPRVEKVADCGPANVYPAKHIAANDPASVLRLCQSHRDIVAMFPASAPKIEYGGFAGFESRDCGDHRTVGPHRAWCFDCSEWCYPDGPCRRCHGVSEVIKVLARGYDIEDGETT